MAQEIREFAVTIPPGTAIDAPLVTQLQMPARQVVELDVRVPPGPRGEVGFTIGSSGIQVIPAQIGTWLVTDNQEIAWPLDGYWDSGSWELTAYNTGQYPHTLRVLFQVNTPQAATTAAVPIPSADLSSSASGPAPVTYTPPAAPAP